MTSASLEAWWRKVAIAGGLSLSVVADAAIEGRGVNQFLHGQRTHAKIHVDGKLDEADWAQAPVFEDFQERFPTAGGPPSERTTVKVLYDDENLYVGIHAYDRNPELISKRLARRDGDVFADAVQVIIDPTHNHKTAYLFYLNAGGVQGDGLFYDDRYYTSDWDGVWDGAAGDAPDGWVAEFAIPLHLLRFAPAEEQTWGFGVRRDIPRKNEELDSTGNPRTSNAVASRLGHLTGLVGLKPERTLELLPYVAARAVMQPQFSDPAIPQPRLFNPSGDVGADLKYQLTSDLAINATVNPDFGQIEADQIILNLSTFENFFPEKRPFFTQGLELFQPVGFTGGGSVPQQLFYSRRIGLGAPILGATKLTGSLPGGWELGALDALVMGPELPGATEENPDRRFAFHPERPLHLGLNSELPGTGPAPMNYFALVARKNVLSNSRVGATVTSALPMTGVCTDAQAALDEDFQPVECLARGGNAAALDVALNSSNSEYGVLAQLDGSQTLGGPPVRTLRDGTELARGATGFGGYLRAGRLGGEGFRWDVAAEYSNPTLELNPSGFQRTQNQQAVQAAVRYQRANGVGRLKSLGLNLSGGNKFTTDGRGTNRGGWVNLNGNFQLPSFDVVGFETGADIGGYNVREIEGAGVPFQQPTSAFFALFAANNPNKPVYLEGSVAVGYHPHTGPVERQFGWGANLLAVLRPHPSFETRLEVNDDRTEYGPRYIDTLDVANTRFLFGDLQSSYLSLTLRQSWIITPRLTLQAYAQLFTDYGIYGPYFEGATDETRRPIHFDELVPIEHTTDESFYETALNLNVVLRWEYRLGSTLYLVYTRAQAGFPTPDGVRPARTLLPNDLGRGAATDAVMVKWSYYWAL